FQADDGIRDRNVTGVQTCALPIYGSADRAHRRAEGGSERRGDPRRCRGDDRRPADRAPALHRRLDRAGERAGQRPASQWNPCGGGCLMNDPKWLDTPAITDQMWPATVETLLMTAWSTGLAVLVGLPLGIWLFTASKGGLNSNQVVYRVLSFIVDVTRSIPFIILIIALIPFARFVVGSALGWQATVVSLTIGA